MIKKYIKRRQKKRKVLKVCCIVLKFASMDYYKLVLLGDPRRSFQQWMIAHSCKVEEDF